MATFDLLKQIGSAIGSLVKPIGVKDESGLVVAPRATTSGDLRTISQAYSSAVTEGKILNHSKINISNRIISPSISLQLMTGEGYIEQASGAKRSLISTHANDSVGGGGIEKICIEYIKGDGTEGIEYVTMTGLTAVDMVEASLKHVNKMYSIKPFDASAAGKISMMSAITGGGVQICAISIGESREMTSHYYVPIGKTLFIDTIFVTTSDKGEVFIRDTSTQDGETFINSHILFYTEKKANHPQGIIIKIEGGHKYETWYTPNAITKTWYTYIEGVLE